MWLWPITFYSWWKVCGGAFHHWCWESMTLTLSVYLISWFTPYKKATRWNLGLIPCSDFHEGEFIQWQWVDKAKNMRIIFSQLPKKTLWQDSPLPLQSFSRSIASTPNYINRKLGLLSLPLFFFTKTFTISLVFIWSHARWKLIIL